MKIDPDEPKPPCSRGVKCGYKMPAYLGLADSSLPWEYTIFARRYISRYYQTRETRADYFGTSVCSRDLHRRDFQVNDGNLRGIATTTASGVFDVRNWKEEEISRDGRIEIVELRAARSFQIPRTPLSAK